MLQSSWVDVSPIESSGSSSPPSREHHWHQEEVPPGAYHNDTIHNGESYLPVLCDSREPQYSNQTLPMQPVSIAPEGECDKGLAEGHTHLHKGMRVRMRGWYLEVIGLLLTLAAFISLLAVLKKVDNQPLFTWDFPFSVNTVVSSLSIITKTPLAFAVGSCLGQGKWSWFTKRSGPLSGFAAFDDASRGPLGCIALLWWLRSRHWASLGAWVTLLLLGVDPFWQAVIQYDGKLVLTGNNDSSILTSRQLSVGDWYYQSTVIADYHGDSDVYKSYSLYPDTGISATLLIAVVNSSASGPTQPPGTSCRTGNCTWPLYTTLGVCNTCFDVTEQVTKEKDFGMPDESVFSSCRDASSTFMTNYTSYVLPYPGTRRVVLQNTDGYVDHAGCKLRSRIGLSAAFQPSDTYMFKESQTLLASFGLLELSADYWNNLTVLEKATPRATECALEFCALAYETQMRDGRLTESIVSRSTTKVNGSYSPSGDLSPEILGYIQQDFGNSLLTDLYEAFNRFSGRIYSIIPRHDLQVTLSDDMDLKNLPGTFNITQMSIFTIAKDLCQNATLESITYAISNTTNITQTFENAARLLTYRMREVDGSKTLGFSEQWVVFTYVRWNFIIFPVIVLASGYIFTIGAVLDSSRLDLKTMKTDVIATLLWGLDAGTREYLRYETQQYDRCSDKITVKLATEADGLQLRAL
ncbi:hypothetical protein GQX73_g9532 [Xylaria multiplex]|uniref:Uncharacterized protein n=1 Tax=Xylaria multiplex TaxID=323545 RepID=A0A7C8IKT9_9PEZI|nr:hypothetical protein GQX73_g9532 [Xylaria multiplex]